MIRNALMGIAILLLAGTAVSFPRSNKPRVDANLNSGAGGRHRQKKFDCLPKDVQPDEVVSYGRTAAARLTVEKKLREIKARCRNGKLVDSKGKEIRFFRVSCWGNPPPDYLEIQQREHAELEKLKQHYTVIVMGCNPMIQ